MGKLTHDENKVNDMKITEYAAAFGKGVAEEMFDDHHATGMRPTDMGRFSAAEFPIHCSFKGKHWQDLRWQTCNACMAACSKAASDRWAELMGM